MVCSKKLVFLAACLLAMASGAIGVTVVGSGQTIAFDTGDPSVPTAPTIVGDANELTISIENGAARYEYATGLDIQAGATVTVTGRRPIYIVAATGNIIISADINLNGEGSTAQTPGGLGGPAGGYPGAGKRAFLDYDLQGPGSGGPCWPTPYDSGNTGTWNCGSGAGYGGAGGMNSQDCNSTDKGDPITPRDIYNGVAYGDPHIYILMGGSGGGGGKDCAGSGGGGGAIGLRAETGNIVVDANITCDGGNPVDDLTGYGKTRYGGGGGSGGSIRIDAGSGTVTINGSLSAKGGKGCNSLWMTDKTDSTNHHGGGGAGGRIAIYTASGSYAGSGNISVTGGIGGFLWNPPVTPPDPDVYITFDGCPGAEGTFNQYAGHIAPLAYNPTPDDKGTNVSIFTGLQWNHGGGTSQDVYFETSSGSLGLIKHDATGTLQQITPAELQAAMGGPLADLTTYEWKVVTNGNTAAAALWSFTTGDSRPHNPDPADNGYEAPYGASVTVSWESDGSLSATAADVYFGTDAAAVAARTATKYTATGAPYTSAAVSAPDRGIRYYWMVDQKYGALTKTGSVWTFRTVAKRINLKTGSGNPIGSASYDIDGAGWLTAPVDDANVVRYQFATFNYDSTWDVNVTGRRAFAIWSDAGISFDGRLNISGGTARNSSHKGGAGIAGGYDGGGDQQGDAETPPWPLVTTDKKNGPGHGNPSNITVENPGMDPQTLVDGSGAGYGGAGGFCSRYLTGFGGAGGISYGQPEVYGLWGGSGGAGGGTGNSSGGGGGGGAVEFYAKAGNITLGANTQIRADGGTIDAQEPNALDYPGGGGSGGSVRLVASANVSVAGLITANGGDGGDNTVADPCDNGGGGGGGRIAVYASGTYSNTGTVTVTGGARGTDTNGNSNAKTGADGTIYTTGKTSNLLKTHGNAPANGYMGWNASADPNFQKVSWYPALGSTQNQLYFGTSQASLALVATYTEPNGLRLQKVYSTGPLTANTKYYWRVDYKYGANPTVTGPVWVFGTGICTALDGDLDGDCKVTFVDFALMASKWRVCNLALLSNCNL